MLIKDLEKKLGGFRGSMDFWDYLPGLSLSEGTRFLLRAASCDWFYDRIYALQLEIQLEGFQVWRLRQTSKGHLIVCEDKQGKELVVDGMFGQPFPFRDFKLFFVVQKQRHVLYLPGEF